MTTVPKEATRSREWDKSDFQESLATEGLPSSLEWKHKHLASGKKKVDSASRDISPLHGECSLCVKSWRPGHGCGGCGAEGAEGQWGQRGCRAAGAAGAAATASEFSGVCWGGRQRKSKQPHLNGRKVAVERLPSNHLSFIWTRQTLEGPKHKTTINTHSEWSPCWIPREIRSVTYDYREIFNSK